MSETYITIECIDGSLSVSKTILDDCPAFEDFYDSDDCCIHIAHYSNIVNHVIDYLDGGKRPSKEMMPIELLCIYTLAHALELEELYKYVNKLLIQLSKSLDSASEILLNEDNPRVNNDFIINLAVGTVVTAIENGDEYLSYVKLSSFSKNVRCKLFEELMRRTNVFQHEDDD